MNRLAIKLLCTAFGSQCKAVDVIGNKVVEDEDLRIVQISGLDHPFDGYFLWASCLLSVAGHIELSVHV